MFNIGLSKKDSKSKRIGKGFETLISDSRFPKLQEEFELSLGKYAYNHRKSMNAVDLGIEKLKRVLVDYYKDKGNAENIFLKAFTSDNSSSAGAIGSNISANDLKKIIGEITPKSREEAENDINAATGINDAEGGNLREKMTAFMNAAYGGNGEKPDLKQIVTEIAFKKKHFLFNKLGLDRSLLSFKKYKGGISPTKDLYNTKFISSRATFRGSMIDFIKSTKSQEKISIEEKKLANDKKENIKKLSIQYMDSHPMPEFTPGMDPTVYSELLKKHALNYAAYTQDTKVQSGESEQSKLLNGLSRYNEMGLNFSTREIEFQKRILAKEYLKKNPLPEFKSGMDQKTYTKLLREHSLRYIAYMRGVTVKLGGKLLEQENVKNPQNMDAVYKDIEETKSPIKEGEKWRKVKDNSFLSDLSKKYGIKVISGISMTTARMMNSYNWLGLSKHALDFRLALLGWMLPCKDHSLWEIIAGSHYAGIKGKEDMTDIISLDQSVDPLTDDEVRENVCEQHELLPDIIMYDKDKRAVAYPSIKGAMYPHEIVYWEQRCRKNVNTYLAEEFMFKNDPEELLKTYYINSPFLSSEYIAELMDSTNSNINDLDIINTLKKLYEIFEKHNTFFYNNDNFNFIDIDGLSKSQKQQAINLEKFIETKVNENIETVSNIDNISNLTTTIESIINNLMSLLDGYKIGNKYILTNYSYQKINEFNMSFYNKMSELIKPYGINDVSDSEATKQTIDSIISEKTYKKNEYNSKIKYNHMAQELAVKLYTTQFYEIMNNMTQKLSGGFNPLYNKMQKGKIAKFFSHDEDEFIETRDENNNIVREKNPNYQSYDDLVNKGLVTGEDAVGNKTYGEKLDREQFDKDLVTDINMSAASLISHPRRSSAIVYRGTADNTIMPVHKVGKEIKVNQFMSTAKLPSAAEKFIGGYEQKTVKKWPFTKYVLLKIQLKGKNAVDITESRDDKKLRSLSVMGDDEAEVLMIPGAKYKVKKATENVNLKKYIENEGGSPEVDKTFNNRKNLRDWSDNIKKNANGNDEKEAKIAQDIIAGGKNDKQRYINANLVGSLIECEETGEDLRKNKNATNNIYSEIFSKNDFGKFNSKFGSYVKKDAEFWKKVNLGSIRVSNEAAELRQKFRFAKTVEEKKALVPQIIKAEKEEPSPSPSIVNFSGDIQKMDGDSQEALNNTLAENEFTGYDSHLLKQFLLSNNYKNMYPIPKKLDDKLDDLQNQEIFLLDDDAPKKIGGGKYHTVYKTKVMQGNEEKEVIWKSIATNNRVNMGKTSSAYMSGINKIEGSAALAERSILTKTLDNYLFPNNSVCAGTKAANMLPGSFGGNSNASSSGIIMDMAKGKAIALREVSFDLSKGPKDANNIRSFDKLSGYISDLGNIESFLLLAATSMKKFHERYPQLQVSKFFSRLKIIDTKMEFNDTNVLKKALEGTIRLGILDYISGQVDRHYENYYVAEDGTVTAIDNDMSFGSEAGARGQRSFLVPNKGSLLVNLPKVITTEIRNELEEFFAGIKSKANTFLDEVKHVFPENSKEYIAVQKRMEDVKKLIIGDNRAMVTDDILSKEAIDNMDSESNYLIRDLLVRQSDATGIVSKFGWNQFRSNRQALKLDKSQVGIEEQCKYLQNSINELRAKKETSSQDTLALTEYEQYLIQSLAAIKAKNKLIRYKLG